MRKLYGLFWLLLILTPLKLEAKVENIGTNNLEILLSKEHDLKKGFQLTLPLKNTSNNEQRVYYELMGFKTKESRGITVKLYETEGDESKLILEYTGAHAITDKPSVFAKGEERSVVLEFKSGHESDEYSGTLIINSLVHPTDEKAGVSESEEVNFILKKHTELKKEPPGLVLEVNHGSKEQIYICEVISFFFGESEDRKFKNDTKGRKANKKGHSINLANKTIGHSINNVLVRPSSFVRVEGEKKISERFDIKKYKREILSIGSNKSEVVSLPLPEISKPGTYNLKFNIEADAVQPQHVEAIVYARYGVWVAVAILLLGSALSYFVTRVIRILRTKHGRSSRIKRIRRGVEDYTDDNGYLKERIRALAGISSSLNRGWIFISEDKSRDFVELGSYLLGVGKRKGEIWHKLQAIGAPQGLVEEASVHLKEVDRLVAKYDVLENKAEIDSQLNKAEEYTNEDKGAPYWPKLRQRIEELLNEIEKAGKLPKTEINDYIEELEGKLKKTKKKSEIEYNQLKSIEQIQRKLDLVWKYRELLERESSNITGVSSEKGVIETIRKEGEEGLKKAIGILQWREENNANWEIIKQYHKEYKVTITPPKYISEGEVVVFTVNFGEDRLNNSYLVRRGLTYDWEFELSAENKWLPKTSTVPKSQGMKTNSLAKYFPEPGTLNVTLKIIYKDGTTDEQIKIGEKGIRVRANEDIRKIRQISKVEVGLSLAALFLAVLFGLQSEYFKKPDFGSPSDFFALFLWAVALDQGKNFVGWIKGFKEAQKES